MRHLVIVIIALTFIALPLFAQESGSGGQAAAASGSGKTFSCEGRTTAVVGDDATGEEGTAGTGVSDTQAVSDEQAYLQDQAAYEEAKELDAQCELPDSSGNFICYDELGQPLTCYCCNPDTEERIAYSDDCYGCCQ